MHRALMAHSDPDQAGRWRQEPVWIGTSATSPVDVEYVALRYKRVPGPIEILRGKGLTRNVTVPISAGLLVDVRAYHRALDAYREGHPDEIVQMGSEAAFRAIENGRQLAADIARAREAWNGKVTARADNAVWKVMDLLERQPVVTSRVVEEELGLSSTTAWRAMRLLEAAGVVAGRNWRSEEVLGALDAFAQRAGRRARAD